MKRFTWLDSGAAANQIHTVAHCRSLARFFMFADVLAILFLLFLALIPVAGFVVGMFRGGYSPLHYVLWSLDRVLAKFLWRTTAESPFPLPPGMGGIIVCNHRSSVDPFFMQAAMTRKAHWMVAREYVESKVFGPFLKWCEVIPVNRAGIDTAATKMAIRLAAQGGLVGMFPEGRINRTEELLLPGRAGAAMVALKARVCIIPCYISGAPFGGAPWTPFLMPARVRVLFGTPLDLAEYRGREEEAGVAEEIIIRAMRGIATLANRSDFQPSLAGRNWKPTAEELAAGEAAVKERKRQRRLASD